MSPRPRLALSLRLCAGSMGAVALEAGSAFAAAGLLLFWSRRIDVNPLDRVGQISGLAAVQFHFALLGMCIFAGAVLVGRLPAGRARELGERLLYAAVAGMGSGVVASGIAVALHGTPWALYGRLGDSGNLQHWANAILATGELPVPYPPLIPHLLAHYARMTTQDVGYALKDLQLLMLAGFGPVAYLSWRLVFRPPWALLLGVGAALPLVQPYKPYPNLALVVFVALYVAYLRSVRGTSTASWRPLICGGVLGAALGTTFLMYAGWTYWSAGGVVVATGIAIARSQHRGQAVLVVCATLFTFVVVAGQQMLHMLRATVAVHDKYIYFDVLTEPTYIAMWRDDLPGQLGTWPPPGELGGVGLFTVVLFAALALSVTLGYRRTLVLAAGSCLASAWLMRFAIARRMFERQEVQLYPRTTVQILYVLLLLLGFALYLVQQRAAVRSQVDQGATEPSVGAGRLVGALVACMLLFASAGSATADRYMPRNDNSVAKLAWVAHTLKTLEGSCPVHAPERKCLEVPPLPPK